MGGAVRALCTAGLMLAGVALLHPSGVGSAGSALTFADPEVRLGDRLFFETRFAHYFYRNAEGETNRALASGDPTVAELGPARSPGTHWAVSRPEHQLPPMPLGRRSPRSQRASFRSNILRLRRQEPDSQT